MSMSEWAKQEVAIACKRENPGIELDESGFPKEFDYGCSCYGSALKAFLSLCEDGHSGMSIGFTKNILNRLIDGKPLTPIEDTGDVWNEITDNHGEYVTYQCRRCYALFKDVYNDGRIEYHYNDQCYCVDINNPGNTYHSNLVSYVIREMYPITMPFMPPEKPIKVYCEEFLTDPKNGDFDTVGIFYAEKDGEKIEINRYFGEKDGNLQEISPAEYNERKWRARKREEGK